MEDYNVVNKILEYLDARRSELSNEMLSVPHGSDDYYALDCMYEVYDHLITKFEDDYR